MKSRSPEFFFYLLPLPLLTLSLFIGPSSAVDAVQVFRWVASSLHLPAILPPDNPDLVRAVVWEVRLPRILLTFLVGGALGCTGGGLQALFRNPLVSPYILGLQSGAAFGAALAMSVGWLPVSLSAFIFGILAVRISYLLARSDHCVSTVTLILAGIVVTGIFTALLTIVQFMIDPFKVMGIVRELVSEGLTAVAVLHDPNFAMMYGQRLLFLRQGRLVEQGGREGPGDIRQLEQVYGMALEMVTYRGRRLVVPRQ